MRMFTTLPLLALLAGSALSSLHAATPAQPARNVVLVHGAWADGSSWSKVIRGSRPPGCTSPRCRIR